MLVLIYFSNIYKLLITKISMNERTLIDILALQNRWWYGKDDFPFNKTHELKRSDYYFLAQKVLESKEAIVLCGPRGVGKSTVMFEIIKKLLGFNENQNQKKDPKRIFYVTFDDAGLKKFTLLELLTIYSKYILKENVSKLSKEIYVFFDEIQNVDEWGSQIKTIQDLQYPIKFFLSGSSSVAMLNESSKSARRIFKCSMYPLKFSDFLRFKINEDSFEKVLKNCAEIKSNFLKSFSTNDPGLLFDTFLGYYNLLKPWQTKIEIYFQEYIIKGGYPEFVNNDDYIEIASKLNQTFTLGFHKDLVLGKGIGDPKGMKDLIDYISSISSSETNLTSLMNNSGATTNTGMLKKYLYHLENSFLVNSSYKYSKGATKSRPNFKIYLTDIAIRNMLQGLLNEILLKESNQIGFVLETLVFDHFLRFFFKLSPGLRLNYWKNKKNQEVDIILPMNGKSIPIEVKNSDSPDIRDLKGILSFCQKNKVPGVVSCGKELSMNKNLVFIPHWLLILIC